jgi:hypothetical protein
MVNQPCIDKIPMPGNGGKFGDYFLISLKSYSVIVKMPLFCAVLLLTTATAMADKIPTEWSKRYLKVEDTYTPKGFMKWKTLMASDYVWTQVDGSKMKRDEVIKVTKPMFMARKMLVTEDIQSVTRRGSLVDVAVDIYSTFVFKSGKRESFHEVAVDTWKRVKGKWLIVGTVDKSFQQTEGS